MSLQCRHFRSREKYGDHIIRSAIAESPMLHVNITPLCFIEWELLPIGVLHQCGNRNFLTFLALVIDLDPMTFIYELDPYALEIYRMCQYELPTSRLSKVIV